MKKFFSEFKKFITRGNVVDMAIGVIVGSAFTAIVNGLSNNILKPVINWLLALVLGADSLSNVHTILLHGGYNEDGTINLTESIYIDWGAFINAIINFFLVAIVLFTILRVVNRMRDGQLKWLKRLERGKLTKADKRELKARGIKLHDLVAVHAYIDEKIARHEAEEKAKAEAEAERKRLEAEANPTAEKLLAEILAELKNK